MNKWLVALFVLVVLFVLVLSISPITNILYPHVPALPSNVYGLTLSIPGSVYRDSNGLTTVEKMNAIALALNNSIIERGIRNNVNVSTTIVIGNITSVSAGEVRGIDSGFLNTSYKIAYLTVGFTGSPHPQFSKDYVVDADLSNNRTLGIIEFDGKVSPNAFITIPSGSIWYTQVYGSAGVVSGNQPSMVPYVQLDEDDVNTTNMMILSSDNFDKYKNGLPYTALKYVDFMTNTTMIANGSQPLHVISINNGIATCGANVSFDDFIPPDANEAFPNFYYYVLIENKNKDKEINIQYMNG